jgi:Nucleoside H+ symporter.
MFWGESFAFFLILMLALNLFTSAQGPLSEALMLSSMRGDLTHYGRLRLWGSVGFIVTVMVAGQLLDWQGIALMPWIALVLLVMVAMVSLNTREEAPIQRSQDTPSVRQLLRQREVIAFFVSTFLMIAAHASLYVYYSLYLSEIGYSKTVIGLMWSLGVVAEILFFYFSGATVSALWRCHADADQSAGRCGEISDDRFWCRISVAAIDRPNTSCCYLWCSSFRVSRDPAALVCRPAAGARAGTVH